MGGQVEFRAVYKTGHNLAGRLAIDLACPSKLYLASVLHQPDIPLQPLPWMVLRLRVLQP